MIQRDRKTNTGTYCGNEGSIEAETSSELRLKTATRTRSLTLVAANQAANGLGRYYAPQSKPAGGVSVCIPMLAIAMRTEAGSG